MHAGNDGDSIWKETNEAALGNFDAWVPALRINARREGAGWRAQAAWRNGDGFNVSFHPKGIRDFAADVGYSAIDVVAKVASCEPHEAMRMLRDKLGLRDPEPVEFRLKMKGEAAPEPFEAAPEPETGKPPGDDALMKIVRAYAKARIANNGDHPKLTDDLRQVYRENFPKIALYQIDPTEAPADLPKSDKTGATSKFALTWLADINLSLDDEWLLKGLVPKTGVVSVFGNSRSFKTFLLIHLAVRGALGRHFGGHQCKNPGPFVYVAAEDPRGVEKRLIGYCMAHDTPRSDVRIAIVGVPPNLGTVKGDAIPLGQAIQAELEAKGYDDPSGIVIDTLNQTLGDAEENGPGMQAFLINAGVLANGFSCSVLAANHVGHAEKDRERGGSQIKGNADTRLQIKRVAEEPTIVDGVKIFEALIHAHKVKNAEDGFSLKATLRQFILGQDADGDDATTLVVLSYDFSR